MTELLLIRHGQASFGAENYDQLSDLGRQQSRVLGKKLRDIGWYPDRVITGSLQRQKQTYEEMGFPTFAEEDPGWNEYDFHDLLHSRFGGQAPTEVIQDRKTHFRALKETLSLWQKGGITNAGESWQVFCNRVEAARKQAIRDGAERVLVVSSGGVIARLTAHALGVPDAQMITLNLQIRNSAVTRFIASQDRFFLNEFNSVPHFSNAETMPLISYS